MKPTEKQIDQMAIEIEYQIASSLDDALCEGKMHPDQYVKENRDILKKIVRDALIKAEFK